MKLVTSLAAILLAIGILLPCEVSATAQASDIIIIDGKQEQLNTNPLAPYLAVHPTAIPESDFHSTANWRGYIAIWEVLDDKLFLRKVLVEFKDPDAKPEDYGSEAKDVLGQVFPDSKNVVATWYSGTLVVPKGEMLRYVHMGYGSTYERYSILTIRYGRVVKLLEFAAEEFENYRESQFNAYKKTEEYAAKYKELKADKSTGDSAMSDKQFEDFLYNFESEHYLSIDFSKSK